MNSARHADPNDGAVLLLSLIMLTLLSLMLASAFRASAFTVSAARWMQNEQQAFRAARNALDAALARITLPAADDVQLPMVQPSADLQLTLHCHYLGRRDSVTRRDQNGSVIVDLGYVQLTANVRARDGTMHQQQLIVAVVLPADYVDGDALPLARDATQADQAGTLIPIAWRNPQER